MEDDMSFQRKIKCSAKRSPLNKTFKYLRQLLTAPFPPRHSYLPPTHTHKIQTSSKVIKLGPWDQHHAQLLS